jgi:hypothetical protein
LKSGTSLTLRLPQYQAPSMVSVKVQREAVAVVGPMLVVVPNGGPQPLPTPLPTPDPPPGALTVQIVLTPRQTVVGIYAVVHDATGGLVSAKCQGMAGNMVLTERQALSNGVPATWQVPKRSGDVITVAAIAADGRTGTGSSVI